MAVKPFVLPDAESFVARVYIYWLKTTGAEIPGRENFCHFWRVVLLWAPLEWISTTKRGWRGILRPLQLLALLPLVLFEWLVIFSSETHVLSVELIGYAIYALVGIIFTNLWFFEELEGGKKVGTARILVTFGSFWGGLLLVLAMIVGSVYLFWTKIGQPLGKGISAAFPKRSKKIKRGPSVTGEFFRRVFNQAHDRVCPPVLFDFDLHRAVGREIHFERGFED